MDDLINGRTPEEIKTAIRECENRACKDCPYYADCLAGETRLRITKDALALIYRLESERDAALAKVPKWISIEERMPKDRQIVYMHTSNGRTFKGIYLSHTGFERYKHGDGWTSVKNVAYWTTLPELPDDEQNKTIVN